MSDRQDQVADLLAAARVAPDAESRVGLLAEARYLLGSEAARLRQLAVVLDGLELEISRMEVGASGGLDHVGRR